MGISAAIAGIADAVASAATTIGVGDATAAIIGSGVTDAAIGGGLGAAESAITGGNPLTGAEGGAITGGIIGGAGPAIGGALGSTTAGDVIAGAGGGALGAGVTGGNPLTGALGGAASGGVASALSGDATTSGSTGGTSASAPTTGGTAPAAPAPAGVAPGGDITLTPDYPGGATGTSSTSNLGGATGGGSSDFSSTGMSLPGGQSAPSGAPTSLNTALSSSQGLDPSGGVTPTTSSALPRTISGAGTDSTVSSTADGGNALPSGGAAKANTLSTLFGSGPGEGATWGNIGSALSANAPLLASGAGLVTNLTSALSPTPGAANLKTEANQLQGLGLQNEQYLASGTLPPGVQGGIDQATQAAIAAIKSKYASMGMSGSSAEQQDIANAEMTAKTQGANIAMNLLNQGVSETGLSSGIYEEMIKNSMATDQSFASAFTNLASAIGGGSGGGGTTIKIGGA